MAKNDIDRIFRENIREIFVDYVNRHLGFDISESSLIPAHITGTFDKIVDFVVEAVSAKGDKFLIHFEFQSYPDKDMLARMAQYHGFLYHLYRLPIYHILVYSGNRKHNMRTELEGAEIFRSYHLVSLGTDNLETYLDLDAPAEIVMGIFSDFGTADEEDAIERLIDHLQRTCKNENELRKYLKQLTMLAKFPKLDSIVEQKARSKMPFDWDWENFAPVLIAKEEARKEGRAEGLEQGREEGREEGWKEGMREGMLSMVKKMIQTGEMTPQRGAQILGVELQELERMVNGRSD